MELREAIQLSLASLATHRLRTGLATLGIVFGVGAVIAMLSIGAGAEREALATIARLGLHNVVIKAKDLRDEEAQELRAKSAGLSPRDGEAILEGVPGAAAVVGVLEVEPWRVLAGTASTSAKVLGVDAGYRELVTVELAEGRFLDAEDQRRHAQVAVIGADVRRSLFGAEGALGQFLKVDDLWLEVIGVLAPVATGGKELEGVDLGSASTAIYAPLSTVQRKLEHDPLDAPLSELIVRLADDTSPRTAAAHIATILDTLHGGVDDTEMVVPEALLAESQRTQRLFNLVMGCIAGISLLVGGIGIMNIMLASVLERTEEIGVRRAVGARREDIRFQFLVESFALSSFGGLAGVVMGVVIARVVAASAGWPTVVTMGSVVLAAGVALVVGVTSGLYPAIRAANLDPIESLRAE